MRKFGWIFIGAITGIFLMVVYLGTGAIQTSLAESSSINQPFAITATGPLSNQHVSTETASLTGGGDELTPANPNAGIQSPSAFILPTPIPGETLVYFVPTDNDATATVLYLYNADSVDHTVALRGFNYDGAMVYAQNITVPASSFRRLVSDSVAAAPPPSWATPAPITTNFTDFVYFASAWFVFPRIALAQ